MAQYLFDVYSMQRVEFQFRDWACGKMIPLL